MQSARMIMATKVMPPDSTFPIRCRQVVDSDTTNIADLLARGLRRLPRQRWLQVLGRLAEHPTPAGLPKYGYLMESDGVPVGVILLISSKVKTGETWAVRCSVSSWYVEPPFRTHATLLFSLALRHKNVTYINSSVARHVERIAEAQGFSRYCNGVFIAFPRPMSRKIEAKVVVGDTPSNGLFEPFEEQLLLAHREFGCLNLWCTTSERAYPFVFLPTVVMRFLPCMQLIYCRDIDEFVRFAHPIQRFLAFRRTPIILINSNGPIPGLLGKYVDGTSPMYFKGPTRPRVGDLAYTEVAMFGFARIGLLRPMLRSFNKIVVQSNTHSASE